MIVHLPAFIGTTLMLAMLPGVGQALMMRQTLTHGASTAMRTVAGTCTGLLVWSTGAAIGLSAILLAQPAALTAIRLVGAVALAILGLGTLRRVGRSGHTTTAATPASTGRAAYVTGLATNLGNPKAGVFAVSLLPQFVRPGAHAALSTFMLGIVWAATTGAWYLVFVHGVQRGRRFMSRPGVMRGMEIATGLVLIGLGAGVAAGF